MMPLITLKIRPDNEYKCLMDTHILKSNMSRQWLTQDLWHNLISNCGFCQTNCGLIGMTTSPFWPPIPVSSLKTFI